DNNTSGRVGGDGSQTSDPNTSGMTGNEQPRTNDNNTSGTTDVDTHGTKEPEPPPVVLPTSLVLNWKRDPKKPIYTHDEEIGPFTVQALHEGKPVKWPAGALTLHTQAQGGWNPLFHQDVAASDDVTGIPLPAAPIKKTIPAGRHKIVASFTFADK